MYKILTINPGSTSTKIAVYEDDKEIFKKTISHPESEISKYKHIVDQYEFRRAAIEETLKENGFNIKDFDCFVGRGGLVKPIPSGTYKVNEKMIEDLKHSPLGEHASNLGGMIAYEFEKETGKPSYIVDPVVVDEMDDIARITGFPEIERVSIFHALNQKATARRAAKDLGKKYEEINLIVVHLGGGISIGAHRNGKVIDVNNALNGDGPFAPERAGSVPAWGLYKFITETKIEEKDFKKRLAGKAGIVAHLGTNDMRKVEDEVKAGNKEYERIYKAMAYNIGKWVGMMAAVLHGKVDAIAITGGLAYDKMFVGWIEEMVSFIAPIKVYPGENEMQALALGGLRVLTKEESAKEYK
ncbi:MAG: butyrate kinase [candidate division WOR-3 bacterium]